MFEGQKDKGQRAGHIRIESNGGWRDVSGTKGAGRRGEAREERKNGRTHKSPTSSKRGGRRYGYKRNTREKKKKKKNREGKS